MLPRPIFLSVALFDAIFLRRANSYADDIEYVVGVVGVDCLLL